MKPTKINMTSVYLQQYTILSLYNATEHHVYGIFQTLNFEYLRLFKRTLNIPCNGNEPKQIYTLQITEVPNSAKRRADSRPSNRWPLKKLQTFPKIYSRTRLIRHVLCSILSAWVNFDSSKSRACITLAMWNVTLLQTNRQKNLSCQQGGLLKFQASSFNIFIPPPPPCHIKWTFPKHFNWNVTKRKDTQPSKGVFRGSLSKWSLAKVANIHTNPYNFEALSPLNTYILGEDYRIHLIFHFNIFEQTENNHSLSQSSHVFALGYGTVFDCITNFQRDQKSTC